MNGAETTPRQDLKTGRRRLYLMRHGHVDYFAGDVSDPRQVPLTEVGAQQAAAAGSALSHVAFDLAVDSGLPRSAATLDIVLKVNAGETPQRRAEADLEELKSGWVKAETREALAAMLAFSFDDAGEPGAQFLPEGETFAAAEARAVGALKRLIADVAWRTAIIVAHEGVNRIILGWACGGGLRSIRAFEQDLGCINVIDLDVVAAGASGGDQGDDGRLAGPLLVERAILKAVNMTPYDYVKHGLPRTSLEHLFDVDFGGARPPQRP